MDTKRIRQKLLDLAIRGDLVPQDPADEPASELLARIHEEKLAMVERGVLKPKDVKGDSFIYVGDDGKHYERVGSKPAVCIQNEIPFELPNGWAWSRLGSLGQWQSGATPKKDHPEYYRDGSVPWLLTGELNDGYINVVQNYITDIALRETSVKLNPAGSVLIAMYGATIGKLGILNIAATTNQACCACKPLCEMSNSYLLYFLMKQKPIFLRQGIGGAQPNISKEIIVGTLAPIPPLAEQKRIIAALDEYLGLVDDLERNESELDDLVKKAKSKVLDLAIRGKLVPQGPDDEPASELLARIHEEKLAMVERGELKPKDVKGDSVIYVGDDGKHYEKVDKKPAICIEDQIPFELPEGWAWSRLLTPVALDPKNLASDDTEAAFLPMASIEERYANVIHPENRKWGEIKKGFTQFADGDVVFAKISPCFENGKYFIADGLINSIGAGTTELFVLRSPSVGLDRKYIFYFLASSYFVYGAKRTFMGTVGQQRIKRDYLEETLIPVPPLEEQKRIVEKCNQLISALESVGA